MTPLARKVFELFGRQELSIKPEGRSVQTHHHAPSWPCPHCGRAATIEDVFPSLDKERTLTMWRCDPCLVVAVTPDTIKQPPIWFKRVMQ